MLILETTIFNGCACVYPCCCVMCVESAVLLPYHQPQRADLSVFLARTKHKQQLLTNSSRW